jgi:carbohydrate kinase (thermoresistant glucokinase family)
MSPIVVVMGVSGVGKTTVGDILASRLHWTFVDGDDLHSPANVDKMSRGIPLTDDDRWPWLASLHELMVEHQRDHQPLVLACSALKAAYRKVLVGDLSAVRFVYLTGARKLIADRLGRRQGHYMAASLLGSQLETLEPPDDAITVEAGGSADDVVSRILPTLTS